MKTILRLIFFFSLFLMTTGEDNYCILRTHNNYILELTLPVNVIGSGRIRATPETEISNSS